MIAALVLAHLLASHDAAGEVLRTAQVITLVEVTGPSKTTPEGSETPAKRVVDVVGVSEAELLLIQRGPHRHRLSAGDRLLAPLGRSPAGRWLYLATRVTRPLTVAPNEQRAALGFVTAWRTPASDADRVDRWIALTRHPASVARRVGFEALSRYGDVVRPAMTPARLARLAAALVEPEVPVERKLAVVRVMALTDGRAAADHLAARLMTLSPVKVRHAAVNLLGRFLTPDGKRALLSCAKHAGGALAERCTRVLARKGAR